MTEGASAAADKYADYSREQLLAEISRLKKSKKYGLVWEHKVEDVIQNFETQQPYLEEVAEKRIENAPDEPTNLIIEGDNYEALSVLNYTHAGKVDVIYIDPPYNTGNKDFIYNDNYVDSEDAFRHSKWLSFMEPRLKLAKNLLKDDGVIFISIDDNECAQLKLLSDAVFNENNFISSYPRLTVKGGKTQTNLSTNNSDSILCYAKDIMKCVFNKISMENDPAYKYSDEYVDTRGKYHTKQMLDTISLGYIASLDYPIEHNGVVYYPGGTPEKNGYRWTWSKAKYEFAVENDFVEFKRGRVSPKKYMKASIEKDSNGKYFISYNQKEKNYSQLDFLDNDFSNTNGNNDLKRIGLSELFSYPKPANLIKKILAMASKKDAVVLDFFAGSGTTGQAVLELNKEDGGHRQFILCTNNGDKGPDSTKIAEEITYPRVKTVITGVRQDGSKYSDGIPANLRYYKIAHREKKQSLDANRQDLAYYIDDIIQVKENAFKQITTEEDYSLYAAKDKYVATVTEPFALEEIVKRIVEINTDKLPLKLYVFSYSRDAFEENFDVDFDIEFAAMPEGLLKTYANIVAEQKKEDL